MMATTSSITPEQSLAQAICAALAFESSYFYEGGSAKDMGGFHSCINCDDDSKNVNLVAFTIAPGTLPVVKDVIEDEEKTRTLEEDEEEEEELFYDTVEHDHELSALDMVGMIRGGASTPVKHLSKSHFAFAAPKQPPSLPRAPPPPKELPLRFLRAGKGDPVVGQERYESTLAWRKQHRMDTILSEAHPDFEVIKKHYPHFFHLRGKKNEPVYYESPPKTDLKALREGGVNLDTLLRHYAMVTEFMWQYVEQDDFARSIYIIDLEGVRVTDFVGECVDFVRQASAFCNQHFPERAGYIMVINVPRWFLLIWKVVKKFADEVTLKKVHILRGKKEVFETMREMIPVENIPPEYGGQSMPLGQAPEETMLWNLMRHNNNVKMQGIKECGGVQGKCQFCTFVPCRCY